MSDHETIKSLSASGALLVYGPTIIITFGYNGLATALGIFYIFIGLSSALASGKETVLTLRFTDAPVEISTQYENHNIRVLLAREKSTYERIAEEQIRRNYKILALEERLAHENPNPYRSLPS